jgi:hypothetical protein
VPRILDDWNKIPFVRATIREGVSECLPGEEDIFKYFYEGINDGWDCDGVITMGAPFGICSGIKGSGSVEFSTFYGDKICGVRGGESFLQTARPGLDGNCPSGTFKCSQNTSPDNTICRASLTDCPITEMKLVSPAVLAAYSKNPEYTI